MDPQPTHPSFTPQVGHAVGRHSLEKLTSLYVDMFALDVAMGAARLVSALFARRDDDPAHAARLRGLEGALQSMMYLRQMEQASERGWGGHQDAARGRGVGVQLRACQRGCGPPTLASLTPACVRALAPPTVSEARVRG